MKNLFCCVGLLAVSCTTSAPASSAISSSTMQQVLDSKLYDIPITAIISDDNTKVNLTIGGTLSNNGNISSTIPLKKEMDSEYYIRVRPNILAISLPYSGKSRAATLAYSTSSTVRKNFATADYSYTVSNHGDKKLITFNFNSKVDGLKTISITIDPRGTAQVTANKLQGQTVKYDGYIYN